MASELARLRRNIVAAAKADDPLLPDAVAALLTHIDVYRCDYRGLAAILPTALAETQAAQPELGPALQVLAAALAAGGEPATRLQQLCGAVTAKAVEDCLFYRDARLVSLNEVGGEPHRFGVGAAEFHHSAATRARLWPQAMTTLTTHDTKRGEDVRARIGVLSQVPSLWTEFVARWEIAGALPRRGNRTVPVAEHLRRLAGERRGQRLAARPTARLRGEGDPGSGLAYVVERPEHRIRGRRCTAGWTPCWTDRWPAS